MVIRGEQFYPHEIWLDHASCPASYITVRKTSATGESSLHLLTIVRLRLRVRPGSQL